MGGLGGRRLLLFLGFCVHPSPIINGPYPCLGFEMAIYRHWRGRNGDRDVVVGG